MDDDSKELVHVATEAGVEAFLRTVAAPLVEVGGWSADVIRRYRFKSAVKTAVLANKWLVDAGLAAHPIPLKVLVPLLEYSSLEEEVEEADDPEEAQAMHERWAALLANAAAGDAGADVFPGFPRILSELTPVEAAGLDWLAHQEHGSNSNRFLEQFGYDPAVGGGRYEAQIHVDNLARLRLCVVERGARMASIPDVQVSALGIALAEACSPPTGTQRGAQSR